MSAWREATFAAASILLAWAALLGTAYAARFRLDLGRGAAIASVAVCYLLLACAAVAALGVNQNGAFGTAGLLVPFTMSMLLVCWR